MSEVGVAKQSETSGRFYRDALHLKQIFNADHLAA